MSVDVVHTPFAQRIRAVLVRANTKGVGYASLASAASSAAAYLTDPHRLRVAMESIGIHHVQPAQLVIALLLCSTVAAYFGMPATVKMHVADSLGKGEPTMSALGKFIGPILESALQIAEADKSALLANLATENVTVVDLAATAVEDALKAANLGVLGNLIKSEIRVAIETNKAHLIEIAGTEEALAFSLLAAKAEAFIKTLEA